MTDQLTADEMPDLKTPEQANTDEMAHAEMPAQDNIDKMRDVEAPLESPELEIPVPPSAESTPKLSDADKEKIKTTVFELHSKGKTAKQIAAHYSLSDFNISESEIFDMIQNKGASGVFLCLMSKDLISVWHPSHGFKPKSD